ncbi:MAG TPA: ABC transporter permease subunit [Burkholderiales bacterium]
MTRRWVDYLLLAAGFLALWQILFLLAGEHALASPAATLRRAGELLASGAFWKHAAETGTAFGLACLVALSSGLALGIWLGFRRLAGEVADPILGSLYSIPKITLYPLILLLFGLGLSAKVAFGAIHGIFPVAIFTMNGIRQVPPVHLKTARVLRLSAWQTAKSVLMPSAAAEIAAGLRVGFSVTLLGTLIGELFASTSGIGYSLVRAMDTHQVVEIMALTFLLFAFAALANSALLALERRVR